MALTASVPDTIGSLAINPFGYVTISLAIGLTKSMVRLSIVMSLTLGMAFIICPWALGKPVFVPSEIEGQGSELIFCDLDGDRLKDAVLIDRLNLSIFYQNTKTGFSRKPQQQIPLGDQPFIVWPARLGRNAESVLVMTSVGITELYFTSRTNLPSRQQIIKPPTIIPEVLDEAQGMCFPCSADTGTVWPLLLVPVAGGLQVWQHRDVWRQAQIIEQAVDTRLQPSVANPGYTRSFGLNMSLGDVNHDRRDDLMVRRNAPGGMQIYTLYLQNADGLFNLEPALSYTNKADWRATLGWIDINHDGHLDLIKSTLSDEPFFVPGIRSGKVLVGAYLADGYGRIPPEPQPVFRKNDWSPALPMVDLDGDGFMDMVMGYIPLNTREGFRKMITAEQIDLNLKFFFYRPGSGFPKAPDFQRDLAINFHHELNPILFTTDRRLYYEWFVNLNGDFNGDGKRDLLVRDHRDSLSVYYFASREKAFNTQADHRFNCPEPIVWLEVKDLNGDGVSDLIIKVQKRNVFRIFTSQTK